MNRPPDPPQRPAKDGRRIIPWLRLIAVVPLCTMCGEDHPAAVAGSAIWQPPYLEQVRQAGVALAEYHTAWGTDTAPYPSDIRQLDTMGITGDLGALLSLRPEHRGDWLYFSAADAENADAPLLISPPLRHGPQPPVRILLTTSGRVDVRTPEETDAVIRSSPVPPDRVPSTAADGF